VNHEFAKGLARRILGSKGMRIGIIYMMLAKEYRMGGIFVKKRN